MRAKMPKAGAATAPADADVARKERRVLLPSNRVALFHVPNVGEFLKLREEAVRSAESAGFATSAHTLATAFGKIVLRKHLRGLSLPVPMIWKAPASTEEVLAACTAAITARRVAQKAQNAQVFSDEEATTAAEALAEVVRLLCGGAGEDAAYARAEELAVVHGVDAEGVYSGAETLATDVEAMKAAAKLQDVTDMAWAGDESSDVATFLAAAPSAELGTADAADWIGLTDYANSLSASLMRVPADPKAKTRIRSLR